MAERRALIARECLDGILIPDLASVIYEYAAVSERDCVMDVLMNVGEMLTFGYYKIRADGYWEMEWMSVWTGPPSREAAERYGISDWKEGDQNIFHLGFGNFYDVYEPGVAITLDELLPSNNLSGVQILNEYQEIFDGCRDQYVAEMQKCIDAM